MHFTHSVPSETQGIPVTIIGDFFYSVTNSFFFSFLGSDPVPVISEPNLIGKNVLLPQSTHICRRGNQIAIAGAAF